MSKTKRTYSAIELASAGHVPLRTVRYYRNQRLLPAPEGRGPAARYTDEHLTLLNTIHDSRNYLPLSQIRRVLAERPAVPEDIGEPAAAISAFLASTAGELPASTDTASVSDLQPIDATPSTGSAAEYAAAALRSMSGYVQGSPGPNTWSVKSAGPAKGGFIDTTLDDIPDVMGAAAPGLALHGSNPPDTDMATLEFPLVKFHSVLPAGSKYQTSPRSTWERIPLSPDLEISVQRPSTRAGNRALERILTSATDILKEEGLL